MVLSKKGEIDGVNGHQAVKETMFTKGETLLTP